MSQIPLNENLPKMYIHSKRKSGYVMGPKIYTFESNESSGADIQIIGRRNKQCQAKIMGTAEQIKMVVKLLQDTLGRTNYFSPSIGFTLLDVSDEYESRYIGKVILPQMESSNVRVLDNQSSKSIYVKVEAIRLNFMSTLQDEGDRVTSEDTVNLIHHYRNIRFQFLEIV
ncbi:1903_t:CDS:2 [Funneliformis caledonium]|uniref:1903_t:CDS:1 n=1 Tax=Funneliformis caledonium TaxID=1117310 RepID=A0A9N8ZGG4_9GLOM|nr:1903_t:CDS:2 [Funneliformis caledonium]